jgi:hypothetical protein
VRKTGIHCKRVLLVNTLLDEFLTKCEEDIQIAYGTSVVLPRCPFVPAIMHAWKGI